MKESIILIGGGGHCKSCIDVIEQENKYHIVGILDAPELVGTKILGYEILGTDDDFPKLLKTVGNFLITVGQIKSPAKRINLYNMVKNGGGRLPVIVSPIAYVARSAAIGEGTIIMHHAIVNNEAQIGFNCILNSKSLIEHETVTGDFCHISTGAIVNGQVKIGDRCFIGSNSVVANNITIVDDSSISAGCQVLKDIKSPGVYIGDPLKKIS